MSFQRIVHRNVPLGEFKKIISLIQDTENPIQSSYEFLKVTFYLDGEERRRSHSFLLFFIPILLHLWVFSVSFLFWFLRIDNGFYYYCNSIKWDFFQNFIHLSTERLQIQSLKWKLSLGPDFFHLSICRCRTKMISRFWLQTYHRAIFHLFCEIESYLEGAWSIDANK